MIDENETDIDDSSLPEAVQQQLAAMVALGYSRAHLVITEDGKVLFDPEAADYDMHKKVFGTEK